MLQAASGARGQSGCGKLEETGSGIGAAAAYKAGHFTCVSDENELPKLQNREKKADFKEKEKQQEECPVIAAKKMRHFVY